MDVAQGVGLSVGATALRAVAIGRSAVRRSPVLTRYPNRPSEVGVPSENPNLVERGLIITDFVDRVGDPVPIVAGDGSSHLADALLADALRALLHAITGGRPPTEPVGVTHPAHWRPASVEALRGALAALPEFAAAELTSDALTALTALQDDPGVPTRGIIALCDFGGTGSSVTLADAANGFRPVGPTVRHGDLSGDLIDQALLTRVVGDLAAAGAVDVSSTSAIGSLGRLRGQCRAAKERLSTTAVTALPVELPGHRTEVRITRAELDDAIRDPLDEFVIVIQDTLQRNRIRPRDLVAVASVGGGARIPILTTTLSQNLRVPVITSGQPELVAAIGGGLTAVRGLVPDTATSLAPAAMAAVETADPVAPASSTFRALAWSAADDLPEPAAPEPTFDDYDDATGLAPSGQPFDPRPRLEFADPEPGDDPATAPVPWYRRPLAMAAIGLVVAVAALGGAAAYVLRNDESPASTTGPVTTTAPPASAPPAQSEAPPATQAPESGAPGPQTVIEQAPPRVVTETQAPPPAETPPPTTTEAPPPPPTTTTTEAPSTVTVTQTSPPPTSASPSTQAPVVPTLPYQTIPGIPFVPSPFQPTQP